MGPSLALIILVHTTPQNLKLTWLLNVTILINYVNRYRLTSIRMELWYCQKRGRDQWLPRMFWHCYQSFTRNQRLFCVNHCLGIFGLSNNSNVFLVQPHLTEDRREPQYADTGV